MLGIKSYNFLRFHNLYLPSCWQLLPTVMGYITSIVFFLTAHNNSTKLKSNFFFYIKGEIVLPGAYFYATKPFFNLPFSHSFI